MALYKGSIINKWMGYLHTGCWYLLLHLKSIHVAPFFTLSLQLQEATEMSFKEGAGSISKSLKMFALQGFGMLLGFAIMFILAMYQNNIQIWYLFLIDLQIIWLYILRDPIRGFSHLILQRGSAIIVSSKYPLLLLHHGKPKFHNPLLFL